MMKFTYIWMRTSSLWRSMISQSQIKTLVEAAQWAKIWKKFNSRKLHILPQTQSFCSECVLNFAVPEIPHSKIKKVGTFKLIFPVTYTLSYNTLITVKKIFSSKNIYYFSLSNIFSICSPLWGYMLLIEDATHCLQKCTSAMTINLHSCS